MAQTVVSCTLTAIPVGLEGGGLGGGGVGGGGLGGGSVPVYQGLKCSTGRAEIRLCQRVESVEGQV